MLHDIGTCAGGKRSRPWQSWACARRLPPVHGSHRLVALRRTHQGDGVGSMCDRETIYATTTPRLINA